MLLGEVGKLREEKRSLKQYVSSYLTTTQSHGYAVRLASCCVYSRSMVQVVNTSPNGEHFALNYYLLFSNFLSA